LIVVPLWVHTGTPVDNLVLGGKDGGKPHPCGKGRRDFSDKAQQVKWSLVDRFIEAPQSKKRETKKGMGSVWRALYRRAEGYHMADNFRKDAPREIRALGTGEHSSQTMTHQNDGAPRFFANVGEPPGQKLSCALGSTYVPVNTRQIRAIP
jgi:hypothetical protein